MFVLESRTVVGVGLGCDFVFLVVIKHAIQKKRLGQTSLMEMFAKK